MLPEIPQPARVRLGKGEKSGRKKEAIVTSIYTISPCIRTPQEIINSLFKIPDILFNKTKTSSENTKTSSELQETSSELNKMKYRRTDSKNRTGLQKRTGPQNKRVWATLAGKEAGISSLAQQVALREGEHIKTRVALTDGSAPLQDKMRQHLSQFPLVLDIIHAVEYLWEAGNSLHGEKSQRRESWVKERTLLLLRGETQAVIADLRALASLPSRKKTARIMLLKVADYYERNASYMHYDAYLGCGWPIATGVIEGACRHLVKDRCELSGMHWRVSGAQALLGLRSVAENGHWESFQIYRRERRQSSLYGRRLDGEVIRIERASVSLRKGVAPCQVA